VPGEAVLIDEFLPVHHASEHHEIVVPAPAAHIYAAIWEADLAASIVVKLLFALRSLPRLVTDPASFPVVARVTLREIVRRGFCLLGEEPGREVLLGVCGRFWTPTGDVVPTDPVRFREPLPAGMARAAWNFAVSKQGPHRGLLTTETRVLCGDAAALRSFRRYWLVVGPFSGLIRGHMLRSIRDAATTAP
jgi:hypothetical protein